MAEQEKNENQEKEPQKLAQEQKPAAKSPYEGKTCALCGSYLTSDGWCPIDCMGSESVH